MNWADDIGVNAAATHRVQNSSSRLLQYWLSTSWRVRIALEYRDGWRFRNQKMVDFDRNIFWSLLCEHRSLLLTNRRCHIPLARKYHTTQQLLSAPYLTVIEVPIFRRLCPIRPQYVKLIAATPLSLETINMFSKHRLSEYETCWCGTLILMIWFHVADFQAAVR